MQFWHPDKKTKVSPEDVGHQNTLKVWWRHICPTTKEQHAWEARIYHVVSAYGRILRVFCPKCSQFAIAPSSQKEALSGKMKSRNMGSLKRVTCYCLLLCTQVLSSIAQV